MLWAISILAAILIGLTIQGVVSDLVAGVIIRREKLIRPGVSIAVDEAYGVVVHTKLRSTVLRNESGDEIVPNARLISRSVSIFKGDCVVPISISVVTSPDSDPRTVERAIRAAAQRSPDIANSLASNVLLTAVSLSSLTFQLTAWTAPGRDYERRCEDLGRCVKVELLLAAIEILEVIPVPKQ